MITPVDIFSPDQNGLPNLGTVSPPQILNGSLLASSAASQFMPSFDKYNPPGSSKPPRAKIIPEGPPRAGIIPEYNPGYDPSNPSGHLTPSGSNSSGGGYTVVGEVQNPSMPGGSGSVPSEPLSDGSAPATNNSLLSPGEPAPMWHAPLLLPENTPEPPVEDTLFPRIASKKISNTTLQQIAKLYT